MLVARVPAMRRLLRRSTPSRRGPSVLRRAPAPRRARSRTGRTARGRSAPRRAPSDEHRAEPAAEEAERDRDDARVGERRSRAASPCRSPAPGHTFGADDHEHDRADTTPNSTPVTAPVGVEPPPRQREQQRREVRARRDREREADHERDVQARAADDRDERSRSRRSTTAAIRATTDLLVLGVLALADDVRPDVVRHGARAPTARAPPPRRGSSRTRRRR